MQTAMQTSQASFSFQANANNHPHGIAQPPLARAGAFDAHRPSPQMSNMQGSFSKTSFSMASHTSPNGSSSTYTSRSTTVSRGYGSNQPQARCDRRDDSFGGRGSTTTDSRGEKNSRQCDRTPPRDDHDRGSDRDDTQWTNTAVNNNSASIDLGNYKLNFNKADSSMTMTNAKTGDTTKIYGDPHIDQHANSGSKSSAMFNGPLTFKLPDDTKITVGTQAAKNNPKISYADDVTITRGNQAYAVKGLSEQNSAGLTVQKSRDGRQLDAATPDGYTLEAARNGKGWIDPTTGKQPTQSDFNHANA